jgi:hypothetical protein
MAKKFGNQERMKANPEAKDLENPKEVWEDGTMAPSPDLNEPETGPIGRVADAGTLGAGDTSPYGIEIQAETIADETLRVEPSTKPCVTPPAAGSRPPASKAK